MCTAPTCCDGHPRCGALMTIAWATPHVVGGVQESLHGNELGGATVLSDRQEVTTRFPRRVPASVYTSPLRAARAWQSS